MQPDWVHTVLARRIAAAGLVVLAGVAAVRSNPQGERTAVVVAAHDFAPGIALTADDLRVESRLTATLPVGSQTDAGPVVGAIPAGPVRRGEVLTDVRLLGSRLAESAAGPDARIVPLHLADNAVVDLVRTGDVVDILAAPLSDASNTAAESRVVATGAVVVLVSAKAKGATAANDRVVLVALPEAAANAVAGAALVNSVTLTLH
jgi:Flp pilus assembly protein CpaB